MTRIAFLGTGVMGVGMASRLIAAGHDLSVFNRTVEKTRPLVEQGACLAMTPREAADGADVVFAMVGVGVLVAWVPVTSASGAA